MICFKTVFDTYAGPTFFRAFNVLAKYLPNPGFFMNFLSNDAPVI